MKTHFASPERSDIQVVKEIASLVQTEEILTKTLNSLTHVVAILNPDRQAVFINQALMKSLGLNSIGMLLGQRPGEIWNCIHSREMEGGCGTSESCAYCGAVQCIVESQHDAVSVTKECRITARVNDDLVSFDLSITSSPLHIQGQIFTLFVANDISNEKRKAALERIFFHDVINTAGGLHGLIGLLEKTNNLHEIRESLSTLQSISTDLLEEILSQRDLMRAEKGEIMVHPVSLDPVELLTDITQKMQVHPVAANRTIRWSWKGNPSELVTDRTLLKRILINMIKNALEATPEGHDITVELTGENGSVSFSVHNPSVMPEAAKSQLFQRSFSTKGPDRGLGTYSMKLLGEKYLRGKISFTSVDQEGTRFTLEIPKILPLPNEADS